MFRSFSNSWQLVKTSFNIIREDKELVIFPLISMLMVFLVSITFAVPAFFVSGNDTLSLVLLFLYYVVVYYIGIFANAAVVSAALKRMQGGNPTFNEAFSDAANRADKIFGWALIAATVGMILQFLRDESDNFVMQILISIVGAAWSITTFLVVPVLVVENLGPIDAIKRSGSLVRQTWGQQLVGNFSIGLIFFFAFLAGIIVLGALGFALASISAALVIPVVILGIVFIGGLLALQTAVSGIFTAAVYAYAANPAMVENPIYDPALVEGAFRSK